MPRRIGLNIRMKIMIPAVLLAIVPTIGLILIINWRINEAAQFNVDTIAKNRINAFEKNLKQQSVHAMTLASVMANWPEIKRGYEAGLSDTISLIESSYIIENNIEKVRSRVDMNIEKNLLVHFHLPKSISFYRSWTDLRGDDLSRYRKSITMVSRRRETVAGFEIGKHGLYIRGVAPVFSNDKQFFYGSVESLIKVSTLLKLTCVNNNDQYAVFALNSKLAAIDKNLLADSHLERIGDFSLMAESSSDFRLANLSPQTIFKSFGTKDKYYSFYNGRFFYAGFPIVDMSGQKIGVAIYQYDYTEVANQVFIIRVAAVISALILMLIIVGIMSLVARRMSSPVTRLSKHIDNLSQGNLIAPIKNLPDDEIGKMGKAINLLLKRINTLISFSEDVAKGFFSSRFEQYHANDDLGKALVKMQQGLMKVEAETIKREEIETRDKRLSEGRAKVGEILRENIDNLDKLTDKLIIFLVKFFRATQGGVFVVGEDEKEGFLQMKASYAYDRKKFISSEFKIGDGLVGVCAFERQTVYMTEIPDEYVEIQSGLGGANPNVLLLIPLVFNDVLFGVVEIASFKKFTKHEISFLESISETIASSLSTVKVNAQTSSLLKKYRAQSDVMRAQEVEMRRSFDEMRTLQKEASLSEQNLKRYVDTLDKSVIRFVVNRTGTITELNEPLLSIGDWKRQDLIGVHFLDVIGRADRIAVLNQWTNFTDTEEQTAHFELRIDILGGSKWINGVFTRSFDIKSNEEQFVFIGINIHSIKQREIILKNKIESIQTAVLYTEFSPEGYITGHADLFIKALGFNRKEVESKTIFELQPNKNSKELQQLWLKLKNGYPVYRVEEYTNNFNEKKIFQVTYIPAFEEQGRLNSILHIAADITKLSGAYQKSQELEHQLKRSIEHTKDIELELNLAESRLAKARKDFAFYQEEQGMRQKKEKVDFEIQKEELKKELVALHTKVNQLEMERNVQKVNYENQIQTIAKIFEEDRKRLNRTITKLEREISVFKGRRAKNF